MSPEELTDRLSRIEEQTALMARMRRRRERRQDLHSITPLTHPILRFRS